MPDDPTTPNLIELVRQVFAAVNRGDLDAAMSFYAPAAVWEAIEMGTSFEGLPAIRGLYEDWIGAYEQYEIVPQQILDLGNGVVLAVNEQTGRPVGSSSEVRLRQGTVSVWMDGMIVRIANYGDVDTGRAAAEQLAESRERDAGLTGTQ